MRRIGSWRAAPSQHANHEDRSRLLWRIAPEPVVALDGDASGPRRGDAGSSTSRCRCFRRRRDACASRSCPKARTPTTFSASGGPAAVSELVGAARPLLSLLWQRETEGRDLDSPERRAALDAALRRALGRIADRSVREHYAVEVRRLRSETLRPAAAPAPRDRRDWRRAQGAGDAVGGDAQLGARGGCRDGGSVARSGDTRRPRPPRRARRRVRG